MIFSISIVLAPDLLMGDPHLGESSLSFHVM